jgi:hypothetical protein
MMALEIVDDAQRARDADAADAQPAQTDAEPSPPRRV